MQEEIQSENELSLSDIFYALLSKIKILILVFVLGCMAGVGLGFATTYGVHYYGTNLEFYITPTLEEGGTVSGESTNAVYGAYGKNVMDNMVKLLSSEIFSEKVLLKGQVLPNVEDWEGEIDESLKAKIEEANEKLLIVEEKNTIVEENKEKANEALNVLKSEWKAALTEKGFTIISYTKEDYEAFKGKLELNSSSALSLAYEEYEGENGAKKVYQDSLSELKEAKEIADKETEEILNVLRSTKEYAKRLNKVRESLSFSYLLESETSSNTSDLARSFIYVEISVLGDNNEQYAKDLLDIIKIAVPAYIEANMIIPSGYDGTSCSATKILVDIQRTNENYARNTMIKYAALLGLASLVVACVVVVIVDRSDKRLRDYDLVAKRFNIPVLGVIPSIEGMSKFAYKANDGNTTEEQK